MTDKLTLTGPADLLAYIPHMLGGTPTESVVVQTATSGNLGATLRVDAPMGADPTGFAQTVTTFATQDETATATYVIVYTGDTGQDETFPYAAHIAALGNELARAGMPVHHAFLVTGTYWAAYGSPERNPLSQIIDSNANATLTYLGSNPAADVYNPAQLGNRIEPVQAPARTEESLATARQAWNTMLDTPGTPETATGRAMAAWFQDPYIRDFLMADTITTNNGRMIDIMLGKFDGAPDWTRVDRAEAMAFELMKLVPEGQRAPMLTLMGWLQWLKGSGTHADRYLKLAAEDAPGYRLAVLLRELITNVYIADVAKNPDTAYKRPRA
ncbi:DUF4192 domain-containing protein [Paenarthrobacter ureafaciens]|uniref:DUF4192 domain-containing protein n=1 Tax=Paenarthrobacter ureafaciens TaxID=37931 RepID=UPI001FB2780A|nr:DUF4192 domain-containing protein [Paenarthrobacter ureafaciens]UOD83374.1 DUF4192 domain-containing protein [Paenarthrobacter ureafaciens]